MKNSNLSVKDLVTIALYLALFMVVDAFINTLPFLQMPQGGSLGVSTVVLLIASYHLGAKKGLIECLASICNWTYVHLRLYPVLIGLLNFFWGIWNRLPIP